MFSVCKLPVCLVCVKCPFTCVLRVNKVSVHLCVNILISSVLVLPSIFILNLLKNYFLLFSLFCCWSLSDGTALCGMSKALLNKQIMMNKFCFCAADQPSIFLNICVKFFNVHQVT